VQKSDRSLVNNFRSIAIPTRNTLGIGSLCVMLASPAGAAPVPRDCEMAGIISSVRSAAGVEIIPLKGARLPAAADQTLCAGDQFSWREPDAEVFAQVHKQREMRFSPGGSIDRVPERSMGYRAPADGPLYAAAAAAAGRPARAELASRSHPRGDEPDLPPPITVAFLPAGNQYVDTATRQIALVWRNAPANVHIASAGQPASEIDSGLRWWVKLPIDPAATPYTIALSDARAPQWSVQHAAKAPSPPWMGEAGPRSAAQRLVRALWLLRSDQQNWKLFAVSEIATLSDDGYFVAVQTWRAILSGEIKEWLK